MTTSATKSETGRRYWERHAKRYDRSTRLLSRPIPRMLELAVEAAEDNERVLEVAAGTGLITTAIAPVVGELIATDYAAAMVKQLEARVREAGISNVRCEQADLYALRFDAGSFDAVFAANVLHLVPDLERALANLRRMLQPGGVLVAPTYLHKETLGASMLSRVFALTGFPGQRRFTSTTLRAAIEAAGFAVTRTEIIPGPFPIGYIEAAAPLTS
ncbi:MAG: methyltransferase domain-containing protein [Deltaproteobacteria bacterium]|nr:methyltransferase domain-containing protein [Deltaproteobacteria bacterium]